MSKLETVEVLMCPMDSIAEFIFVFNCKASRVNDCMSSLTLAMPAAPSKYKGKTDEVDWLSVRHALA
jgi:hypothetical protein